MPKARRPGARRGAQLRGLQGGGGGPHPSARPKVHRPAPRPWPRRPGEASARGPTEAGRPPRGRPPAPGPRPPAGSCRLRAPFGGAGRGARRKGRARALPASPPAAARAARAHAGRRARSEAARAARRPRARARTPPHPRPAPRAPHAVPSAGSAPRPLHRPPVPMNRARPVGLPCSPRERDPVFSLRVVCAACGRSLGHLSVGLAVKSPTQLLCSRWAIMQEGGREDQELSPQCDPDSAPAWSTLCPDRLLQRPPPQTKRC